ncbi:DUF2971 domain-containing protein [Acinetobacter sp. CWB-B33]|uniref:DUF2971 domain-containing protein n=1 Tax=Acinetobacter sp. CWB-B33 TaxID=2815724 RepID=UPI0031FEE458
MTKNENVFIDDNYIYLYKHVDASDGSLCILSEGTLKFNKPENFNDPFDCFFSLDQSFYPKASELKKLNVEYANLPAAKRILHVQKVRNRLSSNQNILPIIKDIQNKAFICCLNQNPLSHLMWSHYAQFHKGFMIEFKIPHNKLDVLKSFNFIPTPVEYTENFPVLDRNDLKNDDTMTKVFLKKSKEWSYEKEYRVVRYGEFDSLFQKYPSGIVLSSVISGLNITDVFYKKLQDNISTVFKKTGNLIQLYKAEKILGKYEITVPNHPRLDVLNASKKMKK